MSTTMSRRTMAALTAAIAGAVATVGLLAAGPSDAKLSHSAKLRAAANGDLKFNTKTITVAHGKVTLTMTNPSGSGVPHAIAIEGKKVDKDGKTAQPGKTSTVSASLKKGTYTYYCPVGSHEAAGMKGKLVVK